MPFTPFHFGPGLLAKSVLPRHYSWTAFVVSQVVIDCETLYYLVQRAYPVHRTLHTFLGGTLAGLATGVHPSGKDVWAIGCIAIKQDFRGRGLSDRIMEAVIREARRSGAKVLEAYPTRPWDEPRSFRGSESAYRRAGFQEIGKEQDGASEILLMQLAYPPYSLYTIGT